MTDKILTFEEYTMESIKKDHKILERKIEFNKECDFNDFSYEIIS